MEDKKEFSVDYFVEKAKRLVGSNPPKMSQEQIEYIANQCRELVRPRTDEERAKISEQLDRDLREHIRNGKERRRAEFYRRFTNQQMVAAQPKKRFFGLMIGWWY